MTFEAVLPKEFAEVPKGLTPLYIEIEEQNLASILKNGFRVKNNQRIETQRYPGTEELFSQVRKEMGYKIDRTNCIFAYPEPPINKGYLLVGESKMVLVKVLVNPNNCLVVSRELYTEAAFYIGQHGLKGAKKYARQYWKKAQPLKSYLKDTPRIFIDPEVLIPRNIPADKVSVI